MVAFSLTQRGTSVATWILATCAIRFAAAKPVPPPAVPPLDDPTERDSKSDELRVEATEEKSTDAQQELVEEIRSLRASVQMLQAELAARSTTVIAVEPVPPPKEPIPRRTPLEKNNFYFGGTLSLTFQNRDDYETLVGTTMARDSPPMCRGSLVAC